MILRMIAHTSQGAFYVLDMGSDSWYCVSPCAPNELPDHVPLEPGDYTVVRSSGDTLEDWWEVLNTGHSEPFYIRVGNTAVMEVDGLAIGNALGVLEENWAVLDTVGAIRRLHKAMVGVDMFTLVVAEPMPRAPELKRLTDHV